MKRVFSALCAASLLLGASSAKAEIKIVGSSTIAPFAHVVRAEIERRNPADRIVIEPTGSGGGIALFCGSRDDSFAPITLSSRRIKDEERAVCDANGQGAVRESVIGLTAAVLAYGNSRHDLRLTRRDLFLALAARVPGSESDCGLVENGAKTWRDVRRDLPDWPIEVYGPPSTSGTRASFIDLAMHEGALDIGCMRRMREENPGVFDRAVADIRSDGPWVDAGENDSVAIEAIIHIPHALGIAGSAALTRHAAEIKAASIDGVAPDDRSIADGTYPLSRKLYIYAKERALESDPLARRFWDEFNSDGAIGANGYLSRHGLIPMSARTAAVEP